MGNSGEPDRTGVEADPVSAVVAWLGRSWDPDITVGDWWGQLADSGWAVPHWPVEHYGRGLGRAEAVAVQNVIRRFGALGPPGGQGLLVAGPTIYTHGFPDQISRLLPDIVNGRRAWCQLFTEPGAGSDLAALSTQAIRDGSGWRIEGHKTWSSHAQDADLGMLLARSEAGVHGAGGLSWMVVDMHQPGIEVRPLREMTGRHLFNEVYFNGARVDARDCVGAPGDGWSVARTTLHFERLGVGAAGGSDSTVRARPGLNSRDLAARAGDFTGGVPAGSARGGAPDALRDGAEEQLLAQAKARGVHRDPLLRQQLAALHTSREIARVMSMRNESGSVPVSANLAKLGMSGLVRAARDLSAGIAGADAALHDYDEGPAKSTSLAGEIILFSPAPSIYGGTDQIQKNVIAERALGLPREVRLS